jgi:hypothetical protein
MTDPSVRLVTNPDGSPNIEVRGRLLHSKRNPLEEARRFLEPVLSTLPDSDTLVILGFGAGYVARALFELRPAWTARPYFSGKALFIENEPALRAMGLEFLPPDVNAHVRLLADVSQVAEFASGSIRLVSLPAHRAMFPHRHKTGVDDSTRHRFFRIWTANTLRRLEYRLRYILSAGLSPESPRASILYCGAAPGLFARKDALLDAEIIAAADTAVAPLLHAGIVPDVVLSIDAGPGTLFHLQAASMAARDLGLSLESIPVFTWAGAHAALESFFSNVWLYRTTFPLDQILGHGPLSSIPEQVNESRNTAGLALILASLLGVRQVALAGTGYVSEGTVTHVAGTGYDLYARLRQCRMRPAAGYRPGSYRPQLSGKHRMSAEGLEAMAGRLGIQLKTPDDSVRSANANLGAPQQGPRSPRILRAQVQMQPHLHTSEPMCGSLLGQWPVVANQLTSFGLTPRDIARRHAQLQDCVAAKSL